MGSGINKLDQNMLQNQEILQKSEPDCIAWYVLGYDDCVQINCDMSCEIQASGMFKCVSFRDQRTRGVVETCTQLNHDGYVCTWC